MKFPAFKASIVNAAPPKGLSLALQALWWDAKGDGDKAHECAQREEDKDGCRVHAYIHRKEGDASNAAYWYRRADEKPCTRPPAEEWDALAREFLAGA